MKKKAIFSGICILAIAIVATIAIKLGVDTYSYYSNSRIYGMDMAHIVVMTLVYFVISIIMLQYMTKVCMQGTYDSEAIVRRKLRTFIIVAILGTMASTYYIQTIAARIYVGSDGIDGVFRLCITLFMGLVSALSLLIAYLINIRNIRLLKLPAVSGKKGETAGSERKLRLMAGLDKRFVKDKPAYETPEQAVFKNIRRMIDVFSVGLLLWTGTSVSVNARGSVIRYIADGNWEHGRNIFAFTACLMVLCVSMTISSLIRYISDALIITMDSRGETIGRMVASLIKYLIILASIFMCLSILGFNTGTLVASAGVLSLVVGLGAKELISDIIAGLFIIVEGEFRVGDIVTIGEFRGTVMEIGVRTTKLVDAVGNIKIINNSQITDVINMTRNYSTANCDVGIGYDEDLEKVEKILTDEFPEIKKRIKKIKKGPYYRGVVELAASSVVIRIAAECAEEDRMQLQRDLNREVKLVFDRNGIGIPYPQIVVNEGRHDGGDDKVK